MTTPDHFPPDSRGLASPEALAHLHYVTCQAITSELTAALARPGRQGIKSELIQVSRMFLAEQSCMHSRRITAEEKASLENIRSLYLEAVQAAMQEDNPKAGVLAEARRTVRMLRDEAPAEVEGGWKELPGAALPFQT